ncbi:regulated potassium-efflux system protein [Seminavis robusta]|uniref:Regulated potassium-efflux system protein n=1 Tax=Seminavis robusta TaxID=568900 RepID=A0A9N8DAU1_9STRA|nr:regulated potassium-efflux system protein [Seminavis robusta]|eukprot:Sro38_g023720.1 regulated potassium-efflux system protein (499) ;mRNA; f:66741-68237
MRACTLLLHSLLLALALPATCAAKSRFAGISSSLPSLPSIKNQPKAFTSTSKDQLPAWALIPRGGDATHAEPAVASATGATTLPAMVTQALTNLASAMKGGKSDTLLLLMVTALVPTICNSVLSMSPILGFLFSGVALGPQGLNLVADIHTTEMLADLGVVLFLFEMGVHLSLPTLWEMRSIVFGLGGLQMTITAILVAAVAKYAGLDTAAQVVLGGGLALSSSAFVLQLLKDKRELETVKGKHSFGVLLLQDLAVVPLLVVTPLLANSGGDTSISTAVITALVQAVMAISAIGIFGKVAMEPLFQAVLSKSKSQEASIAISLATILGMSFLTEGLGLSNTLGAFLAGVLLSETSFRHVVEREVSPIRGILVGLFFFSVGFEIDIPLLLSSKIKTVAAIVVGLMGSKMLITTGLCHLFGGLDLATSQEVGCILSQGGEFAFVAFRLARSLNIFDAELTKLMLTSVSMTMALTPLVEGVGSSLAKSMRKKDSTVVMKYD